jgi:HAD superfamily hydrolase (TIGR01509 family)
MVSWDSIDTVLLDMDGTLLDLHYDNTLWNERLPARYSEAHDLSLEAARSHLFSHMREHHGQLKFYCLDFWAEFTGVDIVGLHREQALTELIRFRPGAELFLDWLKRNGKRSLLVTNAHRASLDVKDAFAGVTSRLHGAVSCHDYGAPKESDEFWRRLALEHPFDPERTLFIDDNDSVLRSAARHGIRHLVTVTQPDSRRPPRDGLNFPAFNDFLEILPGA